MLRLRRVALGAALAAFVLPSLAVEIRWTIVDVAVEDPGSLPVTGSFVFDAQTGVFSQIEITTPAGALLPGAVYTQPGNDAGAARLNFLAPGPTSFVFDLGLTAPLPDSPATIGAGSVAFGAEWGCSGPSFCGFQSPEMTSSRLLSVSDLPVLSGALLSPVPEPASALLAGLGLALLARRRAAR